MSANDQSGCCMTPACVIRKRGDSLTMSLSRRYVRAGGGIAAACLFVLALAGCASSSASAASAAPTPTCPATPAVAVVTGRITAVKSGAITVTTSAGKATQVLITSSTRLTKTVAVKPSTLVAGTPVLVVTDTNATKATSIRIQTGQVGQAGGFGGRGAAGATPPAGVNTACFRQRGQGRGQNGQGQQGQGTGQRGAFQGLRGTVDSATSTKLVFDDAQGQTYSVAILPSTVIDEMVVARASDLKVGQTVIATGTTASAGLSARTILIQPAR